MTHYKGNYPPAVTQQMQQGAQRMMHTAPKEPRDVADAQQNERPPSRAKKTKLDKREQH
jgi:hypothetical protein